MNQALTLAAARRHRPAQSTSLLVPGRTCWRIERARKLGWLIDGEQYFGAVRNAMAQAQSTIFIVGWDIDSRVRLVPIGANDGLPDALGDFLAALLASRPQLNAYILSWDFALLFALEREWLTERRARCRARLRRRSAARHHDSPRLAPGRTTGADSAAFEGAGGADTRSDRAHGDLNEWFLWGRPLRGLHAHFEKMPAAATFPASAPIFALDRIWIEPRSLLDRVWVHKSALARVASDHLPVLARIGRQ